MNENENEQRAVEPLPAAQDQQAIAPAPAAVPPDVVERWLADILSGGPMPSADVLAGADGAATDKQLRAARERLGVVSFQRERRWFMRLPTEDEKQAAAESPEPPSSNGNGEVTVPASAPPARRHGWLPPTTLDWLEAIRVEHEAAVDAWAAAVAAKNAVKERHGQEDRDRRAAIVADLARGREPDIAPVDQQLRRARLSYASSVVDQRRQELAEVVIRALGEMRRRRVELEPVERELSDEIVQALSVAPGGWIAARRRQMQRAIEQLGAGIEVLDQGLDPAELEPQMEVIANA